MRRVPRAQTPCGPRGRPRPPSAPSQTASASRRRPGRKVVWCGVVWCGVVWSNRRKRAGAITGAGQTCSGLVYRAAPRRCRATRDEGRERERRYERGSRSQTGRRPGNLREPKHLLRATIGAGQVVGELAAVRLELRQDVGGAVGVAVDLQGVDDVPAVGGLAVKADALLLQRVRLEEREPAVAPPATIGAGRSDGRRFGTGSAKMSTMRGSSINTINENR